MNSSSYACLFSYLTYGFVLSAAVVVAAALAVHRSPIIAAAYTTCSWTSWTGSCSSVRRAAAAASGQHPCSRRPTATCPFRHKRREHSTHTNQIHGQLDNWHERRLFNNSFLSTLSAHRTSNHTHKTHAELLALTSPHLYLSPKWEKKQNFYFSAFLFFFAATTHRKINKQTAIVKMKMKMEAASRKC